MDIKDLSYTATGGIDCTLNHPSYGWIPYTATLQEAEREASEYNLARAAFIDDVNSLAEEKIAEDRNARLALVTAAADVEEFESDEAKQSSINEQMEAFDAEYIFDKEAYIEAKVGAWQYDGDMFSTTVLELAKTEDVAAYVEAPAVFSEDAIKAECEKRITDVMSKNSQTNMTAALAAERLTIAQTEAFNRGLDWVQSMRSVSSSLIENEVVDYENDSHWPLVPSSVIELVEAF